MQTTTPPWIPDENPALNGPDYVALVIEWDQLEDQVTLVSQPAHRSPRALLHAAGVVAGALGALALALYGIHRLRAA